MDIIKRFSRQAIARILVFQLLLAALVFITSFYGLDLLVVQLAQMKSVPDCQNILNGLTEFLALIKSRFVVYGLPAVLIIFLLTGLAAWSGLRRDLKKLLATPDKKKAQLQETPVKSETVEDQARKHRHDKQMFLYLVSLLQRDGRLIDFLSEDLSLYADAQIGAAVRGIHENCKKVIEKNLSPKPVLDSAEGESITIEAGFNPAAVKLIGNVSGEPPFKGILRHRGWQTKKDELPTLSGTHDAGILAPAEVELT